MESAVPLPLRSDGDRDQVIRAAHRAADHQRQFVHHLVFDSGRDLGVLRLQLRGLRIHLDRFTHLAELQLGVDPDGRAGRYGDAGFDEAPESGGADFDPVDAGQQVGGVVFARART